MGFIDDVSRKVKAKAEEWDVQGKAEKLAAEVDKVAHEAKDKAAAYADENRDKVSGALDKAGATIDQRTKGQYSDKIVKAKQQVEKGVDKLAEQRPGGPHGPGAAPDPGVAGAAAGSAWAGATDSPTAAGHPQDSVGPAPYAPEPYRPDPIDPPAPIDEPPAPAPGYQPGQPG
jgi:ElaB/YqjD/DUF883 family membrane-anchored ribosome-binding protein